MSRVEANAIRIPIGVVALFAAYILGACLGDSLFPESSRVNKMEMFAGKVGCSIGIMVAAFFLGRFLFRSFGVALACLAATELVALIIILQITGPSLSTLSDVTFNAGWLYSMTWNVIVAFVLGAALGHLWYRWSANKHLQPTPR